MVDVLILKAILIGIIEGLTEFLPVSSTGHIILLENIIGFKSPPGKVFEITIQLGAICAICFVYRQKLWQVARDFFYEPKAKHFVFCIFAAVMPAVIFGFGFGHFVKEHLFTLKIVSYSLIIGGFAILLIERLNIKITCNNIDDLSYKKSIYIGLIQCLAMIPGVSRSGATIMGGLILGLDRKTATEFSFFVAIPTMFAASVYSLISNKEELVFESWFLILCGFISAFISAMLVVKFLLNYVAKHNFTIFAIYRILLGSLILYFIV